jgi:hypothetical protein
MLNVAQRNICRREYERKFSPLYAFCVGPLLALFNLLEHVGVFSTRCTLFKMSGRRTSPDGSSNSFSLILYLDTGCLVRFRTNSDCNY